jgi:hypothetical protein
VKTFAWLDSFRADNATRADFNHNGRCSTKRLHGILTFVRNETSGNQEAWAAWVGFCRSLAMKSTATNCYEPAHDTTRTVVWQYPGLLLAKQKHLRRKIAGGESFAQGGLNLFGSDTK